MEGFRATTSMRNDSNAKQALNEKLYYGFRQQHEAMNSMQVVTVPRSISLPISTRSVGFMLRFLICKFARLHIRNVDLHNLCSALYRITLLQLDVKLGQSMRSQFSRNVGTRYFATIDTNYEFVQVVCKLGAYFGPLVNLVSSVGVIRAFGTQFIPRLIEPTVVDLTYSYDPTVVTFGCLRSYVHALSTCITPYDTRKYFYDHCPFPNARWRLQERVRDDPATDENFPILDNADEIMPDNYDLNSLRSDINIIMDAVELIGRKYEKFVHVGRIDFSGNGSYTMFLSNEVDDIRCTDLSWIGNNPTYNMTRPLSGTINHFWSPEMISDSEFYLGSIHLLGELVRKEARNQAYDVRSINIAKQEAIGIDYIAKVQNLLD